MFFWIISQFYFKLHGISFVPVLGILLLFIVSMFAYWTYSSGYFITQFGAIIKFGFQTDAISPTGTSTLVSSLSTVPLIQHFTNYLGFYIFIALTIFGVFLSFSPKNFSFIPKTSSFTRENRNFTFFAILGMLLLFLAFSGIITNVYSIPDRWWYYAEHILPIIAVISIISLSYSLTKNKKTSAILVITLFVLISFFSISNSIANMDSPLFYSKNLAIRSASTTPELYALNTLNSISGDQDLSSDIQFIVPLSNVPEYENKFQTIQPEVYQNSSYDELSGILAFRKYVLDGNIFQSGGAYRLESDPLKTMDNGRFNRIYDSKSVIAYRNRNQ
jgi:hypothetical protein